MLEAAAWGRGEFLKVASLPICRCNRRPKWFWTLAYGYYHDRRPTHGYVASREAAMAAFAKSWRREKGNVGMGGAL